MEPSQTCGIIYFTGCHAFSCSTFCFKFSLSWENTWFWILGACSMWCWKRRFSIFSMIFLHYTTRCPQTSFENKAVWLSFLNSIFINIWPRCWWHGNAHFSPLLLFWYPVRVFLATFLFPYVGLVKWPILGSLVSHGLQGCSAWISAWQAFKMEEFYCFRLCSYSFTLRLFNNFKFTVWFCLFVCFFPRSDCWLVWFGIF